MDEDFAAVDFALVAAPPDRVVMALGQVHRLQARGAPAAAGRRTGLVSRLFGRDAPGPAPLLIQPEGHLPPPPLARLLSDELGFGAGETPFRVTAPLGSRAMTLIEFREADDEVSPVCTALSAELPGTEIYRFRLSGARHPGSDTAFHVYQDGRAVRRTASISAAGTAPEAPWRVIDTGIPHGLEADSLPHARARAWEIMTPARQGAILAALGIEPDTLFDPAPGRVSVDLSSAPGGQPLSAAARRFRAPSPAPEPAAHPADAPAEPSAPGSEMQGAGAHGAGAHGAGAHGDGAYGPDTAEPAPARAQSPVSEPRPAPDGPSVPDGDGAWEAEVTELLVDAVAHALPEAEQVPWLTALTSKLEQGEVETALAEARALIARGDRPEAERAAAAARLDALFGMPPG